jgi:glycosyltransferase involved in cell wall biosynthesis
LSEGLRSRGHETKILVNTRSAGEDNYFLFALKLCLRLLTHLGNPPDWIIARSTDGIFCALLAKSFGLKTKVVLHNHGWEEIVHAVENRLPTRLISSPTTWKARAIRFPMLRASLFLSDLCFSGTLAEMRWLDKKYPRQKYKMRYIPNGVAVGPGNGWAGHGKAPPYFLTVGGDTWKKNLGQAIALFRVVRKKLPEARLYIIGAGSIALNNVNLTEDDRAAMTIVAEENPLRMSRWYTQCPYYISCSRYEGGHSLALLEAMSHGCVAFASAIPSTMEIIHNRVNGILIDNIEPKNDATVILAALEQHELIERIRRCARAAAMRHQWDRQVVRLEKALCPT